MKKLIGLFLLVALSACSPKPYVLIQDVTVFDGESLHENVNFVFLDSVIIDISPKKKRYSGAQIIDGKGMTIIPPLINAHVHVREGENLKAALQHGVFALMDMFSTDNRANALRQFNDSLSYARFYSSNVGATVPGGHGTQFRVSIPTIDDDLSAKQFVNDRIAAGADYIKLTQEHSMEKLSPQQLGDIVQAAHQQDKKVVGHISTLSDALGLASQQVDGLAHIWYRQGAIADASALVSFRNDHLFIIPTLSVIQKVIESAGQNGYADRYLSFPQVQAEVRKAYTAGIPILAGTDAPNYQLNYTTQLYEELILLKACGIPDLAVLKAATTNIYQQFALPDFGLLQPNSMANFILVPGKPHEDISDLKMGMRAWKRGVEVLGS